MKSKKQLRVLLVGIAVMFLVGIAVATAQNKVVVIPLMFDSSAVPTVTSGGGRVWMDRNLGAYRVAESVDDYQAYGWLYQWGRLADGHEIGSSFTTTTLSSGDIPGHGDFITPSSPPYDWRNVQNDNLWQGESGTNNPCPPGFRLPTESEWETELNSWSSQDSTGGFASPLKLVVGGRRIPSDGRVSGGGNAGFYWSSTVDSVDEDAIYLYLGSSSAYMSDWFRAEGFCVRCIKD